MIISQLPEAAGEGGPGSPRDAGSNAGAGGRKRCINMEAACLINDLKPAIKVSLFARDALGVHVLNANFAAERAS